MLYHSRFSRLSTVSLTLLAVTAAACSDLTEDDWRRKRVQEEVTKITEIAGVYRGTLVSRATGEAIAPIELEVAPDISVGDSGNRLYSEQHAGIRGLLTVQGRRKSVVALKSGSYDSSAGALKAVAKIEMKNGAVADLSVSGTLNGDRMTGEIDAAEFPDSGGTFELIRNAPLPEIAGSSGPAMPALDGPQLFTGKWPGGGREIDDIELSVFVQPMSSEQNLLDLFFPVRLADVSLKLNYDLVIYFPNAKWDVRTSKLTGETVYSTSRITIDCDQVALDAGASGWNCRYFTALTGAIPMHFEPKGVAAPGAGT